MFLSKEELKTVATAETVNLITVESTVNDIIAECIDVMKSYLGKHYDVTAVFSAMDDDRSKTVLKHLKSMVIADVYFIRRKDLPEGLEKRYDEAMRWLEKTAKGELEPDLPIKQVDTDGDGIADSGKPFMKIGSRKTYRNHF
jgi:hypothetical protein